MVDAGHDVHVSAPDISAEIADEMLEIGATIHQVCVDRAGMNMHKDIRYFFEMRRLLKAVKPDMVVGYTIKPNIWGGLAARSMGVSSVSMVTGLGYTFIGGSGLKRRLVSHLSRALYRLTTNGNRVVIFQNPDDRDDFIRAKCLTDPSRAKLINGSGVDIVKFAVSPMPEEPIFLLIGRLLVAKGVREYAEAGLTLLSGRVDCRVQIAGFLDDGPDSISQNELDHWKAGGIEFLGSLDDVRPALTQASIYVLPSYREGTPRTVLEAMATGRPVITTDAPGCRETVVDGKTGLLVAVQDVAALLKAMEKLADDGVLRSKMGAAARKYCEEKYDVLKINRKLMDHLGL